MLNDPTTVALLAAIALLASIGVVAFVMKWPALGLWGAIPVAMMPLQYGVAGFPVQLGVVTLLHGVVMLRFWRSTKHVGRLFALTLVFDLLLIVSYAFSESTRVIPPEAARNHLVQLLVCVHIVLTVAVVRPSVMTTLRVLGISGAAVMAYSLVIATPTVTGRIETEALNANGLGHSAAVNAVLLMGLAVHTRQKRWLALSALPLFAVVSTASRGAILTVAVGLGVLWLVKRKPVARTISALFLGAAAIAGWGPIVDGDGATVSLGRDETVVAQSTAVRENLLWLTLRLIQERPFTGVGYRGFPDYSRVGIDAGYNTHNDYLRIAVEAGIPALLILLLIIWQGVRRISATGVGIVVLSSAAAAFTMFTIGNTMSNFAIAMPAWVLLGLGWSGLLDRVDRRGPPKRVTPSGSYSVR